MPPKSPQAPVRRDGASANPLAEVPRWVWIVVAVVVAGAAASFAVLRGSAAEKSGSGSGIAGVMKAAGCTYQDVAPNPPHVLRPQPNFHADFPKLTTPIKANEWSTDPPSAGGHYGQWAVWGFYTTAANPRQVVHNEEHGAVVIWWGPKVSAATVNQLHAFYNQSPDGMFGTPYPSLGDKIALTAWTGDMATYYRQVDVKVDGKTVKKTDYGMGHIAVCPKFDQKAFAAFRSAYVGKGPEGIPLKYNQAGMGPQS